MKYLLIISLLLAIACSGPGGSNEPGYTPPVFHYEDIPEALYLEAWSKGKYLDEGVVFEVGQTISFEFIAYDYNKDQAAWYFDMYPMYADDWKEAMITQDGQITPIGYNEVIHPSPILITEEMKGQWKACVYVVDRENNDSSNECIELYFITDF